MSYIYLAILKDGYAVNEDIIAYFDKHNIILLHIYENIGLIKIVSPELLRNLPFFLEAIELEKLYTLEEE